MSSRIDQCEGLFLNVVKSNGRNTKSCGTSDNTANKSDKLCAICTMDIQIYGERYYISDFPDLSQMTTSMRLYLLRV